MEKQLFHWIVCVCVCVVARHGPYAFQVYESFGEEERDKWTTEQEKTPAKCKYSLCTEGVDAATEMKNVHGTLTQIVDDAKSGWRKKSSTSITDLESGNIVKKTSTFLIPPSLRSYCLLLLAKVMRQRESLCAKHLRSY